jgi:hypothetical protein
VYGYLSVSRPLAKRITKYARGRLERDKSFCPGWTSNAAYQASRLRTVALETHSKIGGKLLGFNVHRKFSHTLDGLVVVDLRKTEPGVLERYMGRDAAAQFRERHAM